MGRHSASHEREDARFGILASLLSRPPMGGKGKPPAAFFPSLRPKQMSPEALAAKVTSIRAKLAERGSP
jgi:hypothetical protein